MTVPTEVSWYRSAKRRNAHHVPLDRVKALCGVTPPEGVDWGPPPEGTPVCGNCARIAREKAAKGVDPRDALVVDRLAGEWPHVRRLLIEEATR